MNRKGFTLIELLVVISIIAMLLAIILPSLQAAKEMATGAVCVSRQKQLMTAWISYYTDFDGFLVGGSNYGWPGLNTGSNRTTPRWVEFPGDGDPFKPFTSTAFYTFESRKRGIREGKLWDYTGNEDLYHCPGDRTMTKNEEPYAAFRSYEITGLMNSEDFLERSGYNASDESTWDNPISKYRQSKIRPGASAPLVDLKVAIKDSDIRSPGTKFVFVEEDVSHYRDPTTTSANDIYATVAWGGWMLFQNGYGWWDRPAAYHKDAGTFGFADGHAEKHKWKEEETIQFINYEITTGPINEDLLWLAKGYVPCR